MRYIAIIISIVIYLSSLYGENNLIVYGISDDIYDATIKAKKLQQKINYSKLLKKKLIVNTMEVDNRWLIVSHIDDKNIIDKIALIVRDKYPSILIIKDKETNRPKISTIHKTSKRDTETEIEWVILTLIGIAGIFSMIWLLRKISRLKRIQNDLEQKQIELLDKILKSGRHYV